LTAKRQVNACRYPLSYALVDIHVIYFSGMSSVSWVLPTWLSPVSVDKPGLGGLQAKEALPQLPNLFSEAENSTILFLRKIQPIGAAPLYSTKDDHVRPCHIAGKSKVLLRARNGN
jgi:hypothetical protein